MEKKISFYISSILVFAFHLNGNGQMQVREEPRHHRVLENEFLRILDVRIPEGDTTLYHYHSTASVIVGFTYSKIGTQVKGGEPVIGQATPGSSSYAPFNEHPVFHRVWNNDTGLFHVMDIELLKKPSSGKLIPFSEPGIIASWQEPLVNAYRISISAGESLRKQPATNPLLLICVKGKSSFRFEPNQKPKTLSAGDFTWIDTQKSFWLTDAGPGGSDFVLLELH